MGQTIIELQERTKEILQVCQNHRLSIKIEKCVFHRQEVEYLGLIIKPNYIATDLTKLKGILEWLLPKKPKDSIDSIGNSYRDTLRSHDYWKSLNKLK